MSSKIEAMILSPDCQYYHPYFYSHPWALRCELGQGRSRSAFRRKARERAEAIYHVLFPNPADAVIFNYRLEDWSNTGPALTEAWEISAEEAAGLLKANIRAEVTQLRFLESMQNRYRHTAVRDLPFDGVEGVRRHRIVWSPSSWIMTGRRWPAAMEALHAAKASTTERILPKTC